MRVWLLMIAVSTVAVPVMAQGPADEIRAARSVSNRAWVDRDVAAYAATITDDFTITTGAGVTYAHDAFLELLRHDFPDAAGRRCVRTPDQVEISASNPLAAEHGHWRCTSQQADGVLAATGTYLAMWRREAGAWKTRSELFVTLACTGSATCTPKP